MKIGDSVLDLGSGAGNDCFVARSIVGETGKVTGIDFTEAMLNKAKENAKKAGFSNDTLFENKVIIELGPGDFLGVALLAFSKGADKVYCVDRFPLVEDNKYKKL